MTITYPALLHFAVVWRGSLLLVLSDAGRGQLYWDLPCGTCFQRPTERHVEMIVGTIITRAVVEHVEEIDLTTKPDAIKAFIDGGMYRCSVLHIHSFDPRRVCFVTGPIPPAQSINLSDRAQVALSLYMQSRP